MDKYSQRVLRDLPDFPPTKLDYYKDYKKLIPDIYKPVKSNRQISTIYNEYLKNKSLYREWYYGLLILLSMQYNINDTDIIKVLKNNDDQIYKYLRKLRKRNKYLELGLSQNITDEYVKFILSPYLKEIHTYLDVGCGLCDGTYYIGKKLNLDEENIYGLNPSDDLLYRALNRAPVNKLLNYNTYDMEGKFPYSRSKFNLVTLFKVLHHANNIDHVLKESRRVLKKGGYLLIKEQDAFCDFDRMLFDIQHLYEYYRYDTKRIKSTGNYVSWLKMNYTITSNGFKLLSYNAPMYYYERNKNVWRFYYCLYQKI